MSRHSSMRLRRRALFAALATIGFADGAAAPATTVTVANCNDSGTGSLRRAVVDAGDMGVVNVPLACTISLQTGAIAVTQKHLTINGSGKDSLTVSGLHDGVAEHDRIFTQNAAGGYLSLNDISIDDGYVMQDTGGCVYSAGDINASRISVRACSANAPASSVSSGGGLSAKGEITLKDSQISDNVVTGQVALGGGLYAKGAMTLQNSQISGNRAAGVYAFGGGAYAFGALQLQNTLVSGNTSVGSYKSPEVQGSYSTAAWGGGISGASTIALQGSIVSSNISQTYGFPQGGGIYARKGSVTLNLSTISNNVGIGLTANGDIDIERSAIVNNVYGGVQQTWGYYMAPTASKSVIVNSTISGNAGNGVTSGNSNTLIANTTIAFNEGFGFQSFDASGQPNTLELQSALLSNNKFDLSADPATGANNLVYKALSSVPSDTITGQCPLLAPLADNGGATFTHALHSRSPALDKGNVIAAGTAPLYDGRGAPFARVVGAAADIGAYETDTHDAIFSMGFDGCP